MNNQLFNSVFNNIIIYRIIFRKVKEINRKIGYQTKQLYDWNSLKSNHNSILISYNYIKLFKEFYNNNNQIDINEYNNHIYTAQKFGRINFLQYFVNELGWKLDDHISSTDLFITAISRSKNKIEMLEYLISLSISFNLDEFNEVLSFALFNIDMVRWLYNNQHLVINNNSMQVDDSNQMDINNSAQVGCFLLETSPREFRICINKGYTESFIFLIEHNSRSYLHSFLNFAELAKLALNRGQLEIAEYLDENAFIPEDFTTNLDSIAHKRNLKCVIWASTHYQTVCTTEAIDYVAVFGSLDIIKWLHENRTEGCTTKAIDNASINGYLEVVRFLHENRTEGCTTWAMDSAATNGHLEVVRFLHENRTEGCTEMAQDRAITTGKLDVFYFLEANRTEGFAHDTFDTLAGIGKLKLVEYLHNKYPNLIVSTRALDTAIKFKHYDTVRFLHSNRTEGCSFEFQSKLNKIINPN